MHLWAIIINKWIATPIIYLKNYSLLIKEYQSLASLRESDPPSDASDATLFASMAEPIPEMAAEPLPGRPRFSRTIHGNFCERKLSVYNPNNNDRFSLAHISNLHK